MTEAEKAEYIGHTFEWGDSKMVIEIQSIDGDEIMAKSLTEWIYKKGQVFKLPHLNMPLRRVYAQVCYSRNKNSTEARVF